MLYFILKIFSRLTLKSYFRRIRIVGMEHIPKEGPVIFIANHPSAFMDPILVASTVKQPLYFIAAGEYVGKGVKGYIFRKWLHMIPVFRPSTRPEDVHKNKDMFNHCFEHLTKGGSLLIFPEGVSVTERKIKPLKTGVARIARGAELMHNLQLDVHIVPVGLNYSNPHKFRSDVFVNIGEAIKVRDFISAEESTEVEQINTLTDTAEKALQETTLHVADDADDTLLKKLNRIYSRDLKQELGIEFQQQEREFEMQKDMLEAISYFRQSDLPRFEKTVEAIDEYVHKLEWHGLTDKDIKELKFQKSFRRFTSYILGLPFFLVGFITNFIPYQLMQLVLKRLRIHETFLGSIGLASGLILFFIFYLTATILTVALTPLSWWGLLLPIVMYITGVYAQLYLAATRYSARRRNLRNVSRRNKTLIEELVVDRRKLVAMLEECRTEFKLNVRK